MIYMVDLALGKHETEAQWNDWVAKMKVPADFFVVPGIRTMQRYKSTNTNPPLYLAMYSVDSVETIGNREYKGIDGGNLRRNEYLDLITLWHRNVFDGLDDAPEVKGTEYLLVVDADPATWAARIPGIQWVRSVGIDESIPSRGISVVDKSTAEEFEGYPSVKVYRPIMEMAKA